MVGMVNQVTYRQNQPSDIQAESTMQITLLGCSIHLMWSGSLPRNMQLAKA